MDGWMGGWMDEQGIDGWLQGSEGWMDTLMGGWINGRIDGCMGNRWLDTNMDGWMDGWMDTLVGGWINGRIR